MIGLHCQPMVVRVKQNGDWILSEFKSGKSCTKTTTNVMCLGETDTY